MTEPAKALGILFLGGGSALAFSIALRGGDPSTVTNLMQSLAGPVIVAIVVIGILWTVLVEG